MADQQKTPHTRTVRHALFEYTDGVGVRRFALRGAQVELSDEDLARGERDGALLGEGESLLTPAAVVAVPATPDVVATNPVVADPAVATAAPGAEPVAADTSGRPATTTTAKPKRA